SSDSVQIQFRFSSDSLIMDPTACERRDKDKNGLLTIVVPDSSAVLLTL
ncbi:hypothetical protein ACN38_g4185, partial [Penicillium nordicum]